MWEWSADVKVDCGGGGRLEESSVQAESLIYPREPSPQLCLSFSTISVRLRLSDIGALSPSAVPLSAIGVSRPAAQYNLDSVA